MSFRSKRVHAAFSQAPIATRIKDSKLTLTEDLQSTRVIDYSKLIRVYGDQCEFDRVNPKPKSNAKGQPAATQPGWQSVHAQQSTAEQMLEAQKKEQST